jgi:succinate-acetate transporter protein
MGLLCLVYLICSLRTNIAFVIIFLSLVVAFSLLAATYFLSALGDATTAGRTLVVRFPPTRLPTPFLQSHLTMLTLN